MELQGIKNLGGNLLGSVDIWGILKLHPGFDG